MDYEYGGISNEEYCHLVNFLQEGVYPDFTDSVNKKNAKDIFRRKAKKFAVRDGTRLFYVEVMAGEVRYREVVRKGDVCKVIGSVHNTDHLGVNATHDRVKSTHYWNRLFQDIKHYVSLCERCQKNAKLETESAKLRPIPPPRRPFQMWGMDLTMLPKSDENYNYLVVAVDYLSKYVEAIPLKTKEATRIVAFFDDICSRYGFPKVLITDQGREFCNQLLEDYCNQNGISHRTSTAYHPQVCFKLILLGYL